jgi:hypothetical protein
MVLKIEAFDVPRASRDAAHHAHEHGRSAGRAVERLSISKVPSTTETQVMEESREENAVGGRAEGMCGIDTYQILIIQGGRAYRRRWKL